MSSSGDRYQAGSSQQPARRPLCVPMAAGRLTGNPQGSVSKHRSSMRCFPHDTRVLTHPATQHIADTTGTICTIQPLLSSGSTQLASKRICQLHEFGHVTVHCERAAAVNEWGGRHGCHQLRSKVHELVLAPALDEGVQACEISNDV